MNYGFGNDRLHVHANGCHLSMMDLRQMTRGLARATRGRARATTGPTWAHAARSSAMTGSLRAHMACARVH